MRFPSLLAGGLALAGLALLAPESRALEEPVVLSRFSFDPSRHSIQLAISGPVTVSTRSLPNPSRLVVDLPGTILRPGPLELSLADPHASRVRIGQYRLLPPVVRIVIETKSEPLIAVQQTHDRLYLTLAPARALDASGEVVAEEPHGHAHAHGEPPRQPPASPSPSELPYGGGESAFETFPGRP